MNNWVRQTALEDAFEEMHGIRPQVDYARVNKETYSIRLTHNGNEVILTETMERGLTKSVLLEHEGVSKTFSSYFSAEKEAEQILRS